MQKEQLIKTLKKASELEKGGNLAMAKEFIDITSKVDSVAEKADKIAENVDTKLSEISDELKKKLSEELNYEIDPEEIRGEKGDKGDKGEKGDKGDKGDTTIVEKVIEKTEVIRETPIITNEIKEVAIHETPLQIKDKLETLKKDKRLDKSAIKGLEEVVDKTHLDRAISILDQRTQFLINKKKGLENPVDTLEYNTSYTPTGSEPIGANYWDSANHTVSTVLENGVILQNGQEVHIYGKNISGGIIYNGTPVAIVASNGSFTAFGTVDITTASSAYAFVGLATQDIAINAFGYVTKIGVVRSIDTSALDEGKPVYVSASGGLTKTYPTVPNYAVNVGICEYKHANQGRINVISLIVPKLNDLSDVDGTPMTTTGQIQVWNQTGQYYDASDNITNYLTKTQYSDIYRQGFLDSNVETNISFNGTNTFTLTSVGASWSYYRAGIKYTITGSKSVVIPGTPIASGHWHIYIDATDGTLTASQTDWTLEDSKVPVATILFNNANTPKYFMADERHTVLLDQRMQWYLHRVEGCKLISAPTISGYTLNSDVDANKTFAISASTLVDQDLKIQVALLTQPNGTATDYTVFYRTNSTTWTWQKSAMPFKYGASYIEWDNGGTMTTGTFTKYYNSYLLVTNYAGSARHTIVSGRGQFSTLATAQAEDVAGFTWGTFDIDESVICYRLTWETNASYTSKGKCVLRGVQAVNISTVTNASSGAGTDHNSLSNLQGGTSNEYYHQTSAVNTVLNNASASKLIGRGSAGGAGAIEEITLGTGLSMSGGNLVSTGNGWTDDGTIVRLATDTDQVVIGASTTTSTSKLVVLGGSLGGARFEANAGIGVFSVVETGSPYANAGIYSNGTYGIGPGTATRDVFLGRSAAGKIRIGSAFNLTGTADLQVNGTVESTGIKMTTSPAAGYVLTSDASGNASWGAPGGIADGDKGDITVSSSGTVWTADPTIIQGKTTVNAAADDYVLISDTSDTNNLKKTKVEDLGYNIQQAGTTTTRRPNLNFASPFSVTDDSINNQTIISFSGTTAAGNQGDFQWNNSGALAGGFGLSTDGATYVYVGDTISAGTVNDTLWSSEGWQQQIGLARPWKETTFAFDPKEGISSYENFTMPPVSYGFANLQYLPYFKMYAGDGTKIPFTFQIPEDYEEGTPVYWHIHFSLEPYALGEQTVGEVNFVIEYVYATNQSDCATPDVFINSSNTIKSCTDVSNQESSFESFCTALDNNSDLLSGSTGIKKNEIIKGFMSIDVNSTYTAEIIPLYIDIDYVSNEFGVYDKRGGKK